MSVVKIIWRLLVGLIITGGGAMLVIPHLEETVLNAATVVGIALVAVGASILAGVFD